MKKFIFPLLVLISAPALAEEIVPTLEQEIPAKIKVQNITSPHIFTLSHENDNLASGTDEYYTSGARASYINLNAKPLAFIAKIAESIPSVDLNDQTAISYSFGQNIYTPSDITVAGPQPEDRPWAAFLYGSAGLTSLTDDHIDEVEMTLGIVGPAALGEETQKFIHDHLSDSDKPKGWSHQLKNEPGLILSAQRRYPQMWNADIDGFSISAGPYAGATLGNIYTYANGGVTLQIAPKGSEWQGMPVRVRPAIPGSGYFALPDDGFDWSIFAGIEGRAMARNIFLDGNSFTDSPSVDKKLLVGDANAGLATTFGRTRITYSVVYRSKEFDGQEDPAIFGVVNLSYRY